MRYSGWVSWAGLGRVTTAGRAYRCGGPCWTRLCDNMSSTMRVLLVADSSAM